MPERIPLLGTQGDVVSGLELLRGVADMCVYTMQSRHLKSIMDTSKNELDTSLNLCRAREQEGSFHAEFTTGSTGEICCIDSASTASVGTSNSGVGTSNSGTSNPVEPGGIEGSASSNEAERERAMQELQEEEAEIEAEFAASEALRLEGRGRRRARHRRFVLGERHAIKTLQTMGF